MCGERWMLWRLELGVLSSGLCVMEFIWWLPVLMGVAKWVVLFSWEILVGVCVWWSI